MDVEKWLKQYKTYISMADRYRRKLERLQFDFGIGAPKGVSSYRLSDIKVQNGTTLYGAVEEADKIVQRYLLKKEQYETIRDHYEDKADEMMKILTDILDYEEMDYIEMRYFKGFSVVKVEMEGGWSERTARRIKTRAFEKIGRFWP